MKIKEHQFIGEWITDERFCERAPRNVFHRQLDKLDLPLDQYANSHILFRKKFSYKKTSQSVTAYISADDYYKLYINGQFVAQGPAPCYHFLYNYNVIDLTEYLVDGEKVIAVHTYYQGLINRVWQSGDFRHGLILDVCQGDKVLVKSDQSFLCQQHSGYEKMHVVGINTQFMERYDSNSDEDAFFDSDYDDGCWKNAKVILHADYKMNIQQTQNLVFERIDPIKTDNGIGVIRIDFGKIYVGYFNVTAVGKKGAKIEFRYGQELNEDGSVRYNMRCNCNYCEEWILSGKKDRLYQFDYKAFRYVEIIAENNVDFSEIYLCARHYPFELKCDLKAEYKKNKDLLDIWELCVNTFKYGVQEVIQDCMDREKGFYVGDGCYTALAHYVLTKDDSILRKLIDDSFSSKFITEGLVTCLDCSHMQEIAEYPLILISLLLWHFRLSNDLEYLKSNYFKAKAVLDEYQKSYENNYLLNNLDRWCVVEWPKNYQDGYAVPVIEGVVCTEPHVSICAYYVHAIKTMNKIADIIGESHYRDESLLLEAFTDAFYDEKAKLFNDGIFSKHFSLPGNLFAYAFELYQDKAFEENFLSLLTKKGYEKTSLFTFFPLLCKFVKDDKKKEILDFITNDGTWKRMLREGATSTFEGWGKDCKKNASLFHLTFASVVVFLSDIDLKNLFA